MIDWTKPVRTKCGKVVRVLCTDRKSPAGDYPIVLLVRDGEYDFYNSLDGRGRGGYYDFENIPEKRVGWINMYDDSRGLMYPSKEEADEYASEGRIACVRVEYEIPAVEFKL